MALQAEFIKENKRGNQSMNSKNLLSQMGIPLAWEDGLPVIPDIILSPNYVVGDIIMSRYEVKELFKGSMGDVYHCIDTRRKTDVALKTIISTGKEDHSKMLSFTNEINRLLNLPVHPNIVTLQRIELVDGYYFLVTEWVSNKDGITLADWQKNHTFTSADIVNFMQQIACGLSHCCKHLSNQDHPYIFGDLKPDNIFVTWNGIFKLGDFSGGHTEGWCAPEFMDGGRGDERSDIYCLGKVANMMFNEVTDYGSDLSDRLDEIFLQCTSYHAEDRFESVAALQSELNALCTEFGLESYDAMKYPATPFMDKYNRAVSALNLGYATKIYEPLKDTFRITHAISQGTFFSINDYMEAVSLDEKKLYTAKYHYLSGNLEEALALLNGHLSTPELLHLKASVLYAKGNLEDCIHCLLSAALTSDHLPSFDLMSSILLDWPAFASRYRYEADAMLERLKKLPKKLLTGYIPFQAQAKFYMLQKDYRMAASYFRRSLQFLNPERDWQTLYYYGACEDAAGNTANSKIILERAASLIQSDLDHLQNSYKSCILFYCLIALGNVKASEELADHLKNTFAIDVAAQVEALRQRMTTKK